MNSTKNVAGAASALAALGVGIAEQVVRMAEKNTPPGRVAEPSPSPARLQISVQFSAEGMSLLRKAQARLLERGVPRAAAKGVTLEHVLREWLETKRD